MEGGEGETKRYRLKTGERKENRETKFRENTMYKEGEQTNRIAALGYRKITKKRERERERDFCGTSERCFPQV